MRWRAVLHCEVCCMRAQSNARLLTLIAFLQLLEKDVEKRLSASDAAEHPWLGGLDKAIQVRGKVADAVAAREAEINAEKASRLTKGRRRGARCRVPAAVV